MSLFIVGWSEWLALPGLDIPWIKAKVDTGAKTSSLHAYDMKVFQRGGEEWIDFTVHPLQRSERETIRAEAPILSWRSVRSSNGTVEERPVVLLEITLVGKTWEIEVTLTNRDEMGFRMLLGRQAMKGRLIVDPSKRFLAESPPSKLRKAMRRGIPSSQ